MPIALVSVSEKKGIVELCRSLAGRGWTIVSTGGTAQELDGAGIPVLRVSELTGFPEILGGRVKTLHPAIHGGILARRRVASDVEQLEEHGLRPIDLVAVNLYPFRRTVARPSTTLAEALDQIDIGGPTLLRAAAKNHSSVWPVCDPEDYDRVLEAVESDDDAEELRRELAAKVFLHTAGYDAAIAAYLDRPTSQRWEEKGLPEKLLTSVVSVQELRYGENPDQQASFYRPGSRQPWGIPGLQQLQGKELSYNNLLDVDGALTALAPFQNYERAVCAILKHTTPCGIAVGRSVKDAYERARSCDPRSAFGSIVAFNQPVTEAAAETLAANFVECLLAPGYAEEALRLLQRKKKLRILRPTDGERLLTGGGHLWNGLEVRGVRGGILVQTVAKAPSLDLAEEAGVRVASAREPKDVEWADLAFAWAAVQAVKSNAILLARDMGTIGIGAGQMSRVDAVHLATWKANEAGHEIAGCVLASDAFFPFPDGVEAAAAAGVRAIVQPGGSIRDAEVIEAADQHGLAMVLTGRRLFRH